MGTQSYTPTQPTPYQQGPYQQSPYQQSPHPQGPNRKGSGPSWFRVWAAIVGTVVAVALVALTVVTWHSHSSQSPATTGTPASASAPAQSGASPATPDHPSGTPVTPVTPSASVMKLQQELGQLNYYEGPVDGIMGSQTIAAIKDLQRQAGLPQTGQMNAATQAALNNYLAHGNNQMNS